MSKFEIKDGKLYQDGEDISNGTSAELKADGETLLLYAKYKASVEKAAEVCFGTPKKRKPRTQTQAKAPAKAPVEETVKAPVLDDESHGDLLEIDDGWYVDTDTGEVF